MVCLLATLWVQLSVSLGNGWPHNALRHHWLMPISCHFRYYKALLVMSLTHVSGTIASVLTFTFIIKKQTVRSKSWEGGGLTFYNQNFNICQLPDGQLLCCFYGKSKQRDTGARHLYIRIHLSRDQLHSVTCLWFRAEVTQSRQFLHHSFVLSVIPSVCRITAKVIRDFIVTIGPTNRRN